MQAILDQIADWLKGMLVDGIMNNLEGMFDAVNQQVSDVASQVGNTPQNFSPGVFSMIRNISESVIIPIAGLFLTFIACYELIQLIIEHNNLANFETWIIFKWIFKTTIAVMLVTHTFDITMAVFDVAQHVVNASSGLISGSTEIDAAALADLRFLEIYDEEIDLDRLVAQLCLVDPIRIWENGRKAGNRFSGYRRYLFQIYQQYIGRDPKYYLPRRF